MKDDAQLLREYAEHQCPVAFDALLRRHVDLVYSAALRQVGGDTHRAEDVSQLVFCELARKARKLLGRPSLAGWLYTTARHVAARAQRAERRRLARELSAQSMMQTTSRIPDDEAWAELRPVLDDALGRLHERDREAVILRFFQNRSFAEVGAALGLKENAARMRVERAMERLRRQLVRRGVVSGAVALGQTLSGHAVTSAPARLADTLIPAALAKAHSAAGIAGWLARRVPWVMESHPWALAGSALVLGIGLSPLVEFPPPSTPPLRVEFATTGNGSPTDTAPPVASLESTWKWDDLVASDYRRFIANLRANGAPNTLVHDLIALELQRHFKDRYAAARRTGAPKEYWVKPSRQGPGEESLRLLAALEREQTAVLRALFGDEARPNAAANLLFCQPDMELVTLAWLPPETAARAVAALEPLRDLESVPPGETKSFTHETLRRHQRRRMAALIDILTPEQLEEYRRRTDRVYEIVRVHTRECDLTADEFRRIAEIDDHRLFIPGATLADRERLAGRLGSILPTHKVETYLRGIDHTYQYARRVAEHLGLPETTADAAWRIKQRALTASDTLWKDTSMDATARRRALAEIAEQAERELRGLLGDDGFLAIRGDWPWWKQLQSP